MSRNGFRPARFFVAPIRVFTNFPQYKNTNIANLVLAVPLEKNWANEVCNIEM